MAGIGNTKEFTATDGSGPTGDVLNVDTVNGIVQVPNGKVIKLYSDAYSTATTQIKARQHQTQVITGPSTRPMLE